MDEGSDSDRFIFSGMVVVPSGLLKRVGKRGATTSNSDGAPEGLPNYLLQFSCR
jgi:hypothetical protein